MDFLHLVFDFRDLLAIYIPLNVSFKVNSLPLLSELFPPVLITVPLTLDRIDVGNNHIVILRKCHIEFTEFLKSLFAELLLVSIQSCQFIMDPSSVISELKLSTCLIEIEISSHLV